MGKRMGRIPQADDIWLVVPVGPSVNRKFISRMFVVSKEWREYGKVVAEAAKEEKITPIPKPTEVEVWVRWYRSKMQVSRNSDADSRVKALLDALEGVAYENDNQIKEFHVKREDTDTKNPRMVVNIKPWGVE